MNTSAENPRIRTIPSGLIFFRLTCIYPFFLAMLLFAAS